MRYWNENGVIKMIYYPICRKCEKCEWEPGKVDRETGNFLQLPGVHCELAGHIIFIADDLPEGCLYELEQVIIAQDVPLDFIEKYGKTQVKG